MWKPFSACKPYENKATSFVTPIWVISCDSYVIITTPWFISSSINDVWFISGLFCWAESYSKYLLLYTRKTFLGNFPKGVIAEWCEMQTSIFRGDAEGSISETGLHQPCCCWNSLPLQWPSGQLGSTLCYSLVSPSFFVWLFYFLYLHDPAWM